MVKVKVRLFGHPSGEVDGQPVVFETRKSQAMLAYLALSAQPVSREVLATLFWPDFSQSQASANLRRNLNSLEKSLRKCLAADRQVVFFKNPAELWVDVQEFRQKIKTVDDHPHVRLEACESCLRTLEDTIHAYQGEFLEGFNLHDCPGFDDWQDQQRQALQQELRQVLTSHIRLCAAKREWDRGILSAQRLVDLDCLDEASQRILIWLFAQSSRRNAALQQYQDCFQVLKKELDQPPEEETTRLYERIRDGVSIELEEFRGIFAEGRLGSQGEPVPVTVLEKAYPAAGILRTKLFIPPPRKKSVDRPQLISKINLGVGGALTLVSAPAGFGKTTLLADWAAQIAFPVGWVSLEADDNDPVRFMTYLIMGLKSIEPQVGEPALGMLGSQQAPVVQTLVAALLNEVSVIKKEFVIILDDYQAITADQIHKAMAYLLEHQCPNLHLVIATRSDPLLPLARLRARNQLVELRAEELRFSRQEVEEFLNLDMGLGLSPQDITLIGERTEGWIAGLQMAAISMSSREDKTAFIQRFSGSQHYILDYLMDEVLSYQPDSIQTFLLETSILEKLTGSLCDALTGDTNGQEMLAALEKSNLFIMPMDDEYTWYRYHHLFAQLLRTRAGNLFDEEQIKALHQQAAAWYQRGGMLEDAVFHALAGGDFVFVADLIERNSQTILAHGEYDLVLKWVTALPPEVINSRLWLEVFHARLLGMLNRTQEMEPILHRLEQLNGQNSEDDELKKISGNISYLRAMAAYKETALDQALEYASMAQKEAKGASQEFQYNLLMLLGAIQLDLGNLEDATSSFSEVIHTLTSYQSLQDLRLVFTALVSLGDIQVIRGELSKAKELYNQACNIALQFGDANLHTLGRVFISLGNIEYQQNELENAKIHIQTGLDHYQKWGHASDMANGYASLARVLHALVNPSEANDVLQKALDESDRPSAGIKAKSFVRQQQCRLMMMDGELSSVDCLMQSVNFQALGAITYNNESDYILQARIMMWRQDYEEASRLLDKLVEAARSNGRKGSLIELFILQALLMHAQHRSDKAFEVLLKALVLAEAQGYLRVFINEGEILRELLVEFLSELNKGNVVVENRRALIRVVDKLFAAFPPSSKLPSEQAGDLLVPSLEPLTRRELEILRLVGKGLSNQEIAQLLFVTNSTVKTHLHHIFDKMEVESRTQLIINAKALNLI